MGLVSLLFQTSSINIYWQHNYIDDKARNMKMPVSFFRIDTPWAPNPQGYRVARVFMLVVVAKGMKFYLMKLYVY
jgi:hypothetical protein